MPEGLLTLDEAALDLLARVMEMPRMRIGGSALQDHFGPAGKSLRAYQLLVPDGHSQSGAPLADHDDVVAELVFSPESGGFGHLSPSGGLTMIDDERISYFKADISAVAQRMMPVSTTKRRLLVAIVDGALWNLGEIRLSGSNQNLSVWLARRLHDLDQWQKLASAVSEYPPHGLRVILTSTAADRLGRRSIGGNLIIPLRHVLKAGAGLLIDQALIKGMLDQRCRGSNGAFSYATDFGLINVGTEDYRFTGAKHRLVIGHLIKAFEAGSPRCRTAEVLHVAGYKNSVNTLGKAFAGRSNWKDFMAESDGMCWAFFNNPVD